MRINHETTAAELMAIAQSLEDIIEILIYPDGSFELIIQEEVIETLNGDSCLSPENPSDAIEVC